MNVNQDSMHRLADLLLTDGSFIDNVVVQGSGPSTYTHVNPATGQAQRVVHLASPDDVKLAVKSAKLAFESWKRTSPADRRRLLQAIASSLRQQEKEFSIIYALEVGTPLAFGRWATNDAAEWFEYYAGWTDKIVGDTIPVPHSEGMDFTVKEPVGVVAKILTWNNPVGGIAMSVAAALAAGCTVVIKPAESAPFGALRFAQVCAQVGLPAGVVNVVVGDAAAGNSLVRDPDVAKISFTGGPATARKLQVAAAENLTPMVFELGGKSANIVFADANLDAAVQFATVITALSGQGCSLPSRLLVQRSVYEEVIAKVTAALAQVKMGDPHLEGITMGPVVNSASCERILNMISAAVAAGDAKCILGGKRAAGDLAAGYFIPATVLRDVAPDSPAAQDEFFGPVVCVMPFDTEDDAIRIANSTRFGLAAYVHTNSINTALRLCRELKAGGIGVNGKMMPASYAAPFGGLGLSGYGREGGREGIEEFLYVKNVAIKI
jgi:aldehyde dehydrogenase (NAD+)